MSRRWLSSLIALLVLTRAALVLTCADVFFYGEELGKGAAAKALLDGLPAAYLDKNYGAHEGGGFVVTHLKALFFLLVGENVLAHKLAALAVTLLILWAGWRLCARHLSEGAGQVFGLLFVFCPAAQLRFSLLGLGTHFEALLFIALVLELALSIAKEARPRTSQLVALGFAAGFGLYFSLQTVPASACAALWILWSRRGRPAARELGCAALGLFLGALPLLFALAHIGLGAIRPAPQSAAPRASFADALGGLTASLREGDFFDWLYAVAIVAGALVALWASRSARIVGAWLALFLALYFASGMATTNANWFFFLRLSPLWFGGIVLLAAGYASLAGGARKLAAGLVALLVLGGLFDLRTLLADARPSALRENWGLLVRTQGYDFREYLERFLWHLHTSDAKRIAVVKHFEADPHLLAPELASALNSPPKAELAELVERWRAGYGDGWELGLPGFGLAVDPSFGHQLEQAFARIAAQPPEEREGLAEALGRIALGLKYDEAKLREAAAFPAPPGLRAPFLRGGGWRLYLLHRMRPDRALAFLDSLPGEQRAEFGRGWREAAQLHMLR
ncbi:MAG: hypothetical protein IPJ19_06575 [Planctomycetes bacterium]|nr:hypothetical protein [Planctomycetota bacterium]